jgi:hypothetical protein
MKKLIVALFLVTSPAWAVVWSAPYCRMYKTHYTTWSGYQAWYEHCLWGTQREDAGYGVDASTITE